MPVLLADVAVEPRELVRLVVAFVVRERGGGRHGADDTRGAPRAASGARADTLVLNYAPVRGRLLQTYSLRTSPTMTPKISSVPSGRMTGYAGFSGRRMKRPCSRSSRFSVNWPSTIATTMSPFCAAGRFSTT